MATVAKSNPTDQIQNIVESAISQSLSSEVVPPSIPVSQAAPLGAATDKFEMRIEMSGTSTAASSGQGGINVLNPTKDKPTQVFTWGNVKIALGMAAGYAAIMAAGVLAAGAAGAVNRKMYNTGGTLGVSTGPDSSQAGLV